MTNYSVKISPRARQVSLKITPSEGLVVVVPRGFNHDLLDDIVASRSTWIEKVFSRYDELPGCLDDVAMPEQIELIALGEVWLLEYIQTSSDSVRVIQAEPGRLRVMGKLGDQRATCKALRRWLMRHAKEKLLICLEQASQECGLSFTKATIRGQRSRWGSCSSTGAINLNYQLLFVSPAMMHYVLLHELCHTVHLNHSAGFYHLLESHIANYRDIESQLKQAWRSMPAWLYRLQAT